MTKWLLHIWNYETLQTCCEMSSNLNCEFAPRLPRRGKNSNASQFFHSINFIDAPQLSYRLKFSKATSMKTIINWMAQFVCYFLVLSAHALVEKTSRDFFFKTSEHPSNYMYHGKINLSEPEGQLNHVISDYWNLNFDLMLVHVMIWWRRWTLNVSNITQSQRQ